MAKRITRIPIEIDPEKYPIFNQPVLKPLTIGNRTFRWKLGELWLVYSSVHRFGIRAVADLISIGVNISHQQPEKDVPSNMGEIIYSILHMIQTLPTADETTIQNVDLVAAVNDMPDYGANELDRVLSFTYALLQRRELTYAQAAQFASVILGRPFKDDAWRRRIERWALLHNIPRPDLRRTVK